MLWRYSRVNRASSVNERDILFLQRNGQTRVVPPACENRVPAAIDKLAVQKPRISRRIVALDRQTQC